MMGATKAYLGDGAYAAVDERGFVLTAENGIEATDTVVICDDPRTGGQTSDSRRGGRRQEYAMKRYAVKCGLFYLSEFPSAHASLDPFFGDLHLRLDQAVKARAALHREGGFDGLALDVVQLTTVEHIVSEADLALYAPEPRTPHGVDPDTI